MWSERAWADAKSKKREILRRILFFGAQVTRVTFPVPNRTAFLLGGVRNVRTVLMEVHSEKWRLFAEQAVVRKAVPLDRGKLS